VPKAPTQSLRGKETVVYAETYRAGCARIRADKRPTLPHLTEGFRVDEVYLLKAGKVKRADGTEQEFQDLRVYLKETVDA